MQKIRGKKHGALWLIFIRTDIDACAAGTELPCEIDIRCSLECPSVTCFRSEYVKNLLHVVSIRTFD